MRSCSCSRRPAPRLVAKVLSKQVETPGLVIVADRYVDSTTAYQGYGRRMPLDLVQAVNMLATGGLTPHKTFLLDCPPAEDSSESDRSRPGCSTIKPPAGWTMKAPGGSRMSLLGFHERVRKGYLELARDEPDRWIVIDGMADPDEVARAIWSAVRDMAEFDELVSRRSASPERQMALLDAADRLTPA